MRVETLQAIHRYEARFGKRPDVDFSKLKNSEEAALVAEIEKELKKPARKKKLTIRTEVEDE